MAPLEIGFTSRECDQEVYYAPALQLCLYPLFVVYESKDALCLAVCHAARVVDSFTRRWIAKLPLR